MRNLPVFRDKVAEYLKLGTRPLDGRPYTQADLADALSFHLTTLSHKMNGDERGKLADGDVRRIKPWLGKAAWNDAASKCQ